MIFDPVLPVIETHPASEMRYKRKKKNQTRTHENGN
jgi:hypothetical protein